MAQNTIPDNRGQLSGLGDKMKAGLTALGVSLGITQITAVSFGALLSAFNAALGIYNSARSSEQVAYNLFHSKDDDITAWFTVVRGILVGDFGNRWNTMWAQAGFVQPSTKIPTRVQDRIALVQKLAVFFTDNPSYEVPEKDVTAAKATALYDAVQAAQSPLQTANVALKTAAGVLRTAQAALVKNMSFLIKILTGTLSRTDPRWQAFGLNIPGDNTTPDAPTGLRATVMGSDILLECDPTALATRYRFRRKIIGVDDEYQLVASSVTPMAMLQDVIGGFTMEFIVQAVNGGSQSRASDPIVVTIPAAVASEPQAKPAEPLAELAAITPNGNGNGNGSYAGSSRLS
jgi:hypothetical protein